MRGGLQMLRARDCRLSTMNHYSTVALILRYFLVSPICTNFDIYFYAYQIRIPVQNATAMTLLP